jgi:hypothetical protein
MELQVVFLYLTSCLRLRSMGKYSGEVVVATLMEEEMEER